MPIAQREYEFTQKDFDRLRKISIEHTGIVVTDDKFDMFYTRLARRIRALSIGSFSEYCDFLEANMDTELHELVNSVTTNLTAFFREQHHFDYLKDEYIPQLIKKNKTNHRIRIWSAGCSTGEESYSIAMTLIQAIPNYKSWDIKILATDIDSNVLATASTGVYNEDRIDGLDSDLIQQFFQKGRGAHEGTVRISQEVRNFVSFKKLNLLKEWPMKQRFDIIFCRNVVIYFDAPTKTVLVERYADILRDEGRLFMGHSESLMRITDKFDLIGHTVYEKAL
ncbi:MAG: protein-glutamate O-methyltransferase [Gammaproteobacteria bacterium]|nr:protein-glutamate O-methyltransferase [Gammaproteobacteria bacterium]